MNEVGTIRRGKETYITACAVRTLAEEFGRRLRSPQRERREVQWASRTTAAKLMAPLVPHFSISLATNLRALSLPPLPPFHQNLLPLGPLLLFPSTRPLSHLPADTETTVELPINNCLSKYGPTIPADACCATQVSLRHVVSPNSTRVFLRPAAFRSRFSGKLNEI